MSNEENVCCIALEIVECGDSEWHNHLYCRVKRKGGHLITNEHVKTFCLGNWENCVYFKQFLKEFRKARD